MNPIVMYEVLELIIENDISIIYEHFVDTISLISAVSMYFTGCSDLKTKFVELLLRIICLAQKSCQNKEGKVGNEEIQQVL